MDDKVKKVSKIIQDERNTLKKELDELYKTLPANQQEYDSKLTCWSYLSVINVKINKILEE